MKFKKFSSSLFGFSRRQVADYILEQNALHTAQIEGIKKEANEKIASLTAEVTELTEKAKVYSHQNFVLANEVRRLQGVTAELTERCDLLQERVTSTTEERDALRVECASLGERNDLLSMECTTLDQAKFALSQKLEVVESHLSFYQNELLKAKSDLKLVALEYRNLQNILKNKESENSIQRDVLLKCLSDVNAEKSVLKEQLYGGNEKSETEARAENVRKEIAEALSEIAKSIREDSSDYGSNYVNIG